MSHHPNFLFLTFKNMLFKSLFTLLTHSSYVLHEILYVYHIIYFLKCFSYSYAEGMEGKKSSSSNQSSLSSFRIKQWVSLKYMENKFVLKETQASDFVSFFLFLRYLESLIVPFLFLYTKDKICSVHWHLYFASEIVNLSMLLNRNYARNTL